MKKLIFILIFMIQSTAAMAFNTSFLKYSPAFYFTAEDTRIMQQTLTNTLNTARDNAKVTWRNPSTGAHGYFIPSGTTIKNGNKCRHLSIFNEARGVSGKSNYQFCKMKDAWKIVY